MSKLTAFIKLPLEEKVLAMKALRYAGMYRWKLLHRPFQSFANDLGEKQAPDFMPENCSEGMYQERIQELYTISWIVDKVCSATPWKSECLVRAFTAKRLLSEHCIPCVVYMGVMADSEGQMLAHAWTKCGEYFITGQEGHERFTVTGCFYS